MVGIVSGRMIMMFVLFGCCCVEIERCAQTSVSWAISGGGIARLQVVSHWHPHGEPSDPTLINSSESFGVWGM